MNCADIVKAIEICGRHADLTKSYLQGEHDQVFLPADTDQIPPDSEDGKALAKLGCHTENDSWFCFT